MLIFFPNKLFDVEEDLTFSRFLEKFNKKAAEKGIDMGSRLNFIVRISNTVDKLRKKLDIPVKEFLDAETLEKVIKRVPKRTVITTHDNKAALHKMYGRDFLRQSIKFINDAQKIRIHSVSKEICNKIAFSPSIMYDKVFDDWFKVWDNDPIDETHVKLVYKELPVMIEEYEKLFKLFHKRLSEFEEGAAQVKFMSGLVTEGVDKILKLTPENEADGVEAKQILVSIVPLLERLFRAQGIVCQALEDIRNVLTVYNRNRIRWVEFLMAMRESLAETKRRTVDIDHVESLFANFYSKNILAKKPKNTSERA